MIYNVNYRFFILAIVILLCSLIFEPFIFRSTISSSLYVFLFVTLFSIMIIFGDLYKEIGSAFLFFLIGVSFSAFMHQDYFFAHIQDYFIFLIVATFYKLFRREVFFNYFYKVWKLFLLSISVFVILSYVGYTENMLFYSDVMQGSYVAKYNPFFGSIHRGFLDFDRVSWFFAEPSYLGFFLGLNLLFFWNEFKLLQKLIVFGASIFSFSKTVFVGFILSFIFLFFLKFLNLKNQTYRHSISFVFFLIVLYVLMQKINVFAEVDDASTVNRLDRITNSLQIIDSEFSFVNLIFGKGSTYIQKFRSIGESNAWMKSLIEHGIITTMIIIAFIYRTTLGSVGALVYAFLSFNFVVILITPLIGLNFLVFYFFTKYSKRHKSMDLLHK